MASQNYRNTVQEWDEKLEQCPYFPSHQIRPARLGHHLIQCRKALSKQPTSPYYHKIDDLVVCKFNSQHHIPKEKMAEHVKKCIGVITVLKGGPSNSPKQFDNGKDGISSIKSGLERMNTHDDDDDDWDDDNRIAYDPTAKAAALPMHLPAGLTPAERRNYRIAKRHDEILDFDGSAGSQYPIQEEPKGRKEPPGASFPPPATESSWSNWNDHSKTTYSSSPKPSPKPQNKVKASGPNNNVRNVVEVPEFEVPPVEPIENNVVITNGGAGKKNKNKKKQPVQTEDGWDQVPVSNKKSGGKNAGKGKPGSGGGGGGNSQPPPGFGNKFAGLGSNGGQKNGGRNQGAGKKF